MKPRLLDLFCGGGGATKGYQPRQPIQNTSANILRGLSKMSTEEQWFEKYGDMAIQLYKQRVTEINKLSNDLRILHFHEISAGDLAEKLVELGYSQPTPNMGSPSLPLDSESKKP